LRIGKDASASDRNRNRIPAQCFCNNQFSHQSQSSIIRVLSNGKATKASGDGFGSLPAGRNYCAVYNTYPNQALACTSRARSRPSFRISHAGPLSPAAWCFARVMRTGRSCLASYAAQALVNSVSQFQSLEVCL
jgi:hypothetical protein